MSDPDSTAPPKLDYFSPTFEPVYAGFWRRSAALVIDAILVVTILSAAEFGTMSLVSVDRNLERVGALGLWTGLWLYHALMESAPWGATIGKLTLGIRVTGLDGSRISFARASGRFWSKPLTWIPTLGIGCLFAAVTPQKQALHDATASTLVVVNGIKSR